jgi:hypothetical protein
MKEVALMFEQKPARVIESRRGHESSASAAASPPGFWERFAARVRSSFEIPYGYEDANGFHYGHEPAPRHCVTQSGTAAKVLTDRACDAMLSASPVPTATHETTVEEREQNSPV